MNKNKLAISILEEMVGHKALKTYTLDDAVCLVAETDFIVEAMEKYEEAKAGQVDAVVIGKDKIIDRLRGQLQNCVNHLERSKNSSPRRFSHVYDEAIQSANKSLYETLDQ